MTAANYARIAFAKRSPLLDTLKQRVDAYFAERHTRPTGNARLYGKALFGYALLLSSYVFLVFFAESLWSAILAAFLLVQGNVLVAFNVMHDGGHGSFSRKSWVNRLTGASMDFLGGSSMLWRQKHNQLHHTYTNIDGKDDDIAIGSLMRLSPNQEWKPWHRLQHFYAPVLYSLLSMYLVFYSDWNQIFSNRIGNTPLQERSKGETAYFFVTKLAYFGYALVLPALFHPLWLVIAFFVGVHLLFGFTLSIVFQLAHTVEGTAFPVPAEGTGAIDDDWATHQLRTTADFAPTNPLAAFYMGGLNFQVEHHLFHRVSHIHYPQIARIVRETCTEFGAPYICFPSVRAAVVAHFRHLRRLGLAPQAA